MFFSLYEQLPLKIHLKVDVSAKRVQALGRGQALGPPHHKAVVGGTAHLPGFFRGEGCAIPLTKEVLNLVGPSSMTRPWLVGKAVKGQGGAPGLFSLRASNPPERPLESPVLTPPLDTSKKVSSPAALSFGPLSSLLHWHINPLEAKIIISYLGFHTPYSSY